MAADDADMYIEGCEMVLEAFIGGSDMGGADMGGSNMPGDDCIGGARHILRQEGC
jgi:hypothetical protein